MDAAVIVFWFGRELIIVEAGGMQTLELPDRGDEVGAFVQAIQGRASPPKTLRLIYHPADIELHTAECAKGRRDVVRATLSESHPALRRADAVWAVSRLHPMETGHATLLWLEAKPRLFRLRETLARCGVRLLGAWPLASLFELSPPTDQVGEPAVAVLLTDGGGVVYAVTPGGVRTLVWSLGREHRTQVAGLLRNALSHFSADRPPPVLVVDSSSEPWNLGVGPLAGFEPTALSLDEFMRPAQQLAPGSLADFIPQQTVLKIDALLRGGAAVGVLITVILGAVYFSEYRRLQGDARVRRALADQLHAEATRLQQNEGTLAELRAFEAETKSAAAGRLALISAVIQTKPVELTVHSITLNGQGFEITGTAHDVQAQPSGPYQRFVGGLAAEPARWKITPESRSVRPSDGRFTISGTFP
jgi:hypothetical protein